MPNIRAESLIRGDKPGSGHTCVMSDTLCESSAWQVAEDPTARGTLRRKKPG